MNYYISGQSGFLGQAIIKYLKKENQIVFPIPRDQSMYQLRSLFYFNNPDYIIHTAAYGNHYDQKDFIKMVEVNIINTYNILEAASTYDYKLFYNISTSSVMLKDQTQYSITKYCGEQLAKMYKNVINVRPYSIYGPGEANHRLIPTVISCLNSGKEMILDEQADHAWIFIDDLVQALFFGLTELGGYFYSNKEIVSMLEDISGKKLKYTSCKLRDYNCSDVTEPGICYTSIYDGLKRTYDYYTAHQFEEK
jgi:nucleoside-diphosphate-sugar epimerase